MAHITAIGSLLCNWNLAPEGVGPCQVCTAKTVCELGLGFGFRGRGPGSRSDYRKGFLLYLSV